MKYILTTLFLGLILSVFSQNTILKSGTWCEGNLTLTANLEEGTTLTGWEKNGIMLVGETSTTIDCMLYGKGDYQAILKTESTKSTIHYDLSSETGPSASFKATNYLAAAVTYFVDESVSAKKIVAWHWDFGNGETSTEQNPKVMFKDQKEYTITLIVTDEDGCSHSFTKTHIWAYK